MKSLRPIAVATFLALAGISLAGEHEVVEYKIAVAENDGSGAVTVDLDSETMGFNLHDLQEGESRSIVDKSGRNILVTRNADGFSLNVDGKTIDMPMISGNHGMVWVGDDHAENIDVQVLHEGAMSNSTASFSDGPAGRTILSAEPIDDATKEGIKSLLISSGNTDEVRFIDSNFAHGGIHGVKVVSNTVKALA